MSSCSEIAFPDLSLVVEVPQRKDFLVEIEGNAPVADIEQCYSQTIEFESCTTGIEFHTSHNVIIELDREMLIIEFPESVVINNPDPQPTEGICAVVCTMEAGENINTNRVVSVAPDGRIVHADKDDPDTPYDVVGISRQSGSTGQMVEVVKFGRLAGASFGLPSDNFFLGNNGVVQGSISATGTWLSIGVQLTASEFYVNIGEPIRRN
jgi:hypothetical protein